MPEQLQPGSSPKLLLTIDEAARRLSLSRSLMYQLVLSGQIMSVKIGRSRRVPVAALSGFVNHHLAMLQHHQEENQ